MAAKVFIYCVGFMLFFGLVMPFILGFFIDFSEVEPSPLISPFIDFVDDGVSIFTFEINIFAIFGDTFKDYLVDSLTFFSILPDPIIIFIFLLCGFGIVYALIKLLPTT